MRTPILLFLLLCAARLATGQVTAPNPPSPSPTPPQFWGGSASPQNPSASSSAPAAGTSAAPGALNGFVSDDTYKLRAGDTVSFQILEDKIWDPTNTPVSLLVEDSGEVEAPYIGRVMAVNKTCKELAVEIKTALEKDYYNKATVVVSLNTANRVIGHVYIWGQVHNQGAVDLQLNENLTAGEAILLAGGFLDFANKTKVKVVRGGSGPNGGNQSFSLDMTQILDEGKTGEDIVLQPNDLIIVPSRLVNF
jgi:protein involved in polysaccharide export with SLBB domain